MNKEPVLLEGGLGPDIIPPIYTATDKKNPVKDLMVKNQIAVSIPSEQIAAIPLVREEYWQYVKLPGESAKKELDRIVGTPSFQGLREGGPEGGKARVVKTIIARHRAAARRQKLAENEELKRLFTERKVGAAQAFQGETKIGITP